MADMGGMTKQQWATVGWGGIAAWIGLGLAGVPVIGAFGLIAAVVGGIQYSRTPASPPTGEQGDKAPEEGQPW